ncbi:cell division protein FtsB [Janthinobacterium lividum]
MLLLGGNKSSQQRDIKQAQAILRELKARQAALKKAAASPSTGARKK